jgi:hypothetical protein
MATRDVFLSMEEAGAVAGGWLPSTPVTTLLRTTLYSGIVT